MGEARPASERPPHRLYPPEGGRSDAASSWASRLGHNARVHRISSSGIMHTVLWSVGEPGREIRMSAQENKDLVRREQEELWNHTGDLDAAQELFAAEQAEAAKQEAADFRQGFPDVVSTIEDLIAEGIEWLLIGGAEPPTRGTTWTSPRLAIESNSRASPYTA